MSTRCTTWLYDGREPFAASAGKPLEDYAVEARIYRHSDGYPEGHGTDLLGFLSDVEAQCSDTRFSDASYLASKLVVHFARAFASDYDAQSGQFVSHADERPLDFLSLGIVSQDPGDIEYVYVLDCSQSSSNVPSFRPRLTCYEVTHGPLGGDWSARDTYLGAEQEIPAPPLPCPHCGATTSALVSDVDGSTALLCPLHGDVSEGSETRV